MSYIPNRSAFVLIPEEPMLGWVQQVNDKGIDMDTLFGEAEVYLVPAFEEDAEMDAVLEGLWQRLFEIELQAWSQDKSTWPKDRSLDLFLKWFKFTPFNGVHDLGSEPIELEKD
jgi:hypothetical protein